MPDYIATQSISLDDQLSPGANAATAALNKMADAADAATASTDAVSASVTKAGPSATALANRWDVSTKAARDLAAAQAALANAQATMNAAVAAGTTTQATADNVTSGLTAKVRSAQAAVDQLSASSKAGAAAASGMAIANDEAAASAGRAAEGHAGYYREIVILGHEAITGNFSRIPGSLLVLAERSGQLDTIMQGVVKTVTSLPGILALAGVAGVAAFGFIAASAEGFVQRNIDLQNQLRATKDDYVALAGEAQAAAHIAVLQTPGLSTADASAAAGTLLAVPGYSGTTQQLATLTELAANMAKIFREDVSKAATELAAAMENPGEAADKLVGKLRGMTQALADTVKAESDAGDKAEAFATLEKVLSDASTGAAQDLAPIARGFNEIRLAWDNLFASGNGVSGQSLGLEIAKGVEIGLDAIAKLLAGIGLLHDSFERFAFGGQAGTGDGSVSGTIDSVGASLNAPAGVIGLAQRIAPIESPTGQYNADGSVVTGPVTKYGQAIGALQVEPSNAAGQDLNTLTGNVTAAETLLIHLWTKYAGDQRLVAMAYNWGEGNVDKYLAGTQAAPDSVVSYAAKATGGAIGSSTTGVVNTGTDQENEALQKSNGSLAAQQDALQSQIHLLDQVKQQYEDTGQVGSDAWNRVNTQLQAATLQYSNLQDPLAKTLTQIHDQRDAQNDLATAYASGYAAVADATAHTQAFNAALQSVGLQSAGFDDAVAKLTVQYKALADATNAAQIAQATQANGTQLETLQAETDSLGTNTQARSIMLADLKAEQDLRAKNISALSTEGKAYLDSADAVATQSAALAKSQQTISDLEGLSTQAFDTISSSITNAFASGGKAALDFGTIATTVLSQVIAELLKVAALNPVLNSLFGGDRTTLSDIGGLLGNLSGTDSLASSAGSDGTTLLGSGDIQSGLSSTLSFSPASGSTSFLGGIASTPLFGTATVGSGLAGAGLGFGAGSLANGLIGGNSTGGQVGSAAGALAGAAIGSIIPGIGTVIGGLIGGLGGGLLGGLFGNNKPSDKTEYSYQDFSTGKVTSGGSSGKEESSANSAAAAGLAGVIYGAEQSLTSAFNLAGLTGASGGVTAKVGSRDGIFAQIGTGEKFSADNSTAGSTTVVNEAVGAIVTQLGAGFDSTTAALLKEIDYSNSNASSQVSALAAAVTNGKLDATQLSALPNINTASVDSATADLDFIKNTYEPTVNDAANSGSIATQTKAISDSFETLIAHATRLGLATDVLTAAQNAQVQAVNDNTAQVVGASRSSITAAYQTENGQALAGSLTTFDANSAQSQLQLTSTFKGLYGDSYKTQSDYVAQVALLTQTLAEQRADLITSYSAQQRLLADTTNQNDITNEAAGLKARGQIESYSSDPTIQAQGRYYDEQADLLNFDAQGKTAVEQYEQQLTSAYGAGYAKTSAYASEIVDLESSLAEQRLAIIASYAQQAKAAQTSAESAATGVITSLSSYVASLQQGSASPLNAQSQYHLAQSQFNAVLGAAQAGDANSLGQVQSYASAYLAASQNVNGSGATYAADFGSVLPALQAVAAIPQSQLTQEFMAAALQTQTDTLAAGLAALNASVKAVQVELMQQGMRPAA